MAEGRQRDQWQHTASLLCLLHNINCQRGKEKKPHHFYPFKVEEKKQESLGVEDLKIAFQRSFPK